MNEPAAGAAVANELLRAEGVAKVFRTEVAEIEVLRGIVRRSGLGHPQFERSRGNGLGRRVEQQGAAGIGDMSVLDQALHPLARQVGQCFGERPVQA